MKQIQQCSTLFILLFLFLEETTAQFALIQDSEGFVNVRSDLSFKNNVTDTLASNRIVWCFEAEGDWYNVDYYKKSNYGNGYVHKSRIKMISTFENIPAKKLEEGQIAFQKDSVKVRIIERKFIAAEHKLQYSTNSGSRYLYKIDNEKPWGIDGNQPRRQYNSIEFTFGKRTVFVPIDGLKNLFDPNLGYTEVHYDRKKDILYVSALNGDGAGGYVVLLIIEQGQYKTRMVFNGF